MAAYLVLAVLGCLLERVLGRLLEREHPVGKLVSVREPVWLVMVRAHLVRPVVVLAELVPPVLCVMRTQVHRMLVGVLRFLLKMHRIDLENLPEPGQV